MTILISDGSNAPLVTVLHGKVVDHADDVQTAQPNTQDPPVVLHRSHDFIFTLRFCVN